MVITRNLIRFAFLICLMILPGSAVFASPGIDPTNLDDLTLDEIALELSNPATVLRSIGNEVEYRTMQGDLPKAGDQQSLVYRFEPSYSFKLKSGNNIITRLSVPVSFTKAEWGVWPDHPLHQIDRDYTEFLLRQSPQITADTGRFYPVHDHLDDIAYDVAYGGTNANGFIRMYGIAGVFPTSQNIDGAREQSLLGPEIALGKVTDWGVFGAWVKHLVNIGGDKTFDTSETHIDIFFAYGLGNGWQIISNPTILYDWEADSGNHLLLPLGGGVSKTVRWGRTPIRMDLELQYFVASADRFGPKWLLNFDITPVIRGW